jgi:hypothetical protein
LGKEPDFKDFTGDFWVNTGEINFILTAANLHEKIIGKQMLCGQAALSCDGDMFMKIERIGVLFLAVIAGFGGCKSSGQIPPQTQPVIVQEQPAAVVPQRENPYLKLIDQSLYTPFISEQVGPLPDHVTVKVAQWGIMDGYDVLGYIEIPGDTIQDRIRGAEKYARAYGGEVIMAKGITSKEQLKSIYRDKVIQGFLVWRKKPASSGTLQINVLDPSGKKIVETKEPVKKQDDSLLQDLTEDAGVPKVYSQYAALTRLTYNMLLENSAERKALTFRGASYVLKLFKVPDDLGIQAAGDQKMAMLATKSGENKLFLLVPADRVQWIQDFIKNDKVMEFVYKPAGLYKEKYPVLSFVDEMK